MKFYTIAKKARYHPTWDNCLAFTLDGDKYLHTVNNSGGYENKSTVKEWERAGWILTPISDDVLFELAIKLGV